MSTIQDFIKRHALVTYYALVFVISWGGFLLLGGPNFFLGTDWQTDPLFQLAVTAMLAGPPVAGLLMTGLAYGRRGFRDLFSRLVKWRVGARWYALALLTAPVVVTLVLLTLSLTSPVFLPSVFTAVDKVGLVVSGIVIGLIGALAEELGWTGFAIGQFRQRYSILATGLMMGLLWGMWHLLQMVWVGRASTEDLSPVFFFSLYFLTSFANLTAYRVLMVWVYDRTGSLLLATLMHASYIFSTLFVFAPPITGMPFLIFSMIFMVVLWLIVAAVAIANGGRFLRQPLYKEMSVASS
jgi:membrane protease YdiL (CAAX protease family)